MTPTGLTRIAATILLFMMLIQTVGCGSTQERPQRIDNICEIFRENPDWYKSARKSSKRWSIPIPVLMAIMHQESKFDAEAKPPRTSCLCIFPGPRPSSAYGYAQALDETWENYKRSAGNWGADRDDFADAVDFVGWYCGLSRRKCGIAGNDAYNLYLAYHEGHTGFNRKTYRKKGWLLRVSTKVKRRARTYTSQLAACEGEFSKGGCCLWPF
jgi:hypothetical protein